MGHKLTSDCLNIDTLRISEDINDWNEITIKNKFSLIKT